MNQFRQQEGIDDAAVLEKKLINQYKQDGSPINQEIQYITPSYVVSPNNESPNYANEIENQFSSVKKQVVSPPQINEEVDVPEEEIKENESSFEFKPDPDFLKKLNDNMRINEQINEQKQVLDPEPPVAI